MTIKQNVIDTFKNYGFEIDEVKGNSRWGKNMYAVWHDGVQYAIDYHGQVDESGNPDIAHSAGHLKIMMENEIYHKKIKKIYDHLMNFDMGDIWVMSGGGSQIQAFFGNKSGYIAIIYLEMENVKKPKDKQHTLTIQWAKNNRYFNGKVASFQDDGVNIRLAHQAQEGDEDYDEDYEEIYNS